MAMQRKNPIPPGVYWIDVFGSRTGIPKFQAWIKKNRDQVRVVRVVRTVGGSGIDMPANTHWWYLFKVLKPVQRWPVDAKLGLPTIAPKGEDTEKGDTVSRPKVNDAGDWFSSFGAGASSSLAAIALLWWFTQKK